MKTSCLRLLLLVVIFTANNVNMKDKDCTCKPCKPCVPCYQPCKPQTLKQFIDMHDWNQDETLDNTEMSTYLNRKTSEFQKSFSSSDEDGNGKLNLRELRTFMKQNSDLFDDVSKPLLDNFCSCDACTVTGGGE